MANSNCTVSFYRNDLQKTRLNKGVCPVKNCDIDINKQKAPYQRYRGKMRYMPFCSEHGIRIHNNGFIYYNGKSKSNLISATKRNLMFHNDYYINNFLKKSNKIESGRLCYENSEDALTYNVFTELLSNGQALKKLASYISNKKIDDTVELYLWGGKINLRNNTFKKYEPLEIVRKHLEGDIKYYGTEPDIMLIVPKKMVICIEAKFGSKNPIAKEKKENEGEKPSKKDKLIERYCERNNIINSSQIFNFDDMPTLFYEQLFRNIIFASSMAKLENNADWFVVNLRDQHILNTKRGQPESMPIKRNIRSILKPKYKNRFTHLTWEEIFTKFIKGNDDLADLTWYLKNKSLSCGRAFNIL